MALTFQEVDGFFEKYGWETDKKNDNAWYVYVKGKYTNYNLYADLSEHFLFIYIIPFVHIPEDEKCRVNLYDHLLRLNRDISVTKFVISGEVVELLGVLATDSVQYEEFEGLIQLLLYNADENYLEVMNLSGDPNEISSYLKEGEDEEKESAGEGDSAGENGGDDGGGNGDDLDWDSGDS